LRALPHGKIWSCVARKEKCNIGCWKEVATIWVKVKKGLKDESSLFFRFGVWFANPKWHQKWWHRSYKLKRLFQGIVPFRVVELPLIWRANGLHLAQCGDVHANSLCGKALRVLLQEKKGGEMESSYWSSQATFYYMRRKEVEF
jgi:hypothetical protein